MSKEPLVRRYHVLTHPVAEDGVVWCFTRSVMTNRWMWVRDLVEWEKKAMVVMIYQLPNLQTMIALSPATT